MNSIDIKEEMRVLMQVYEMSTNEEVISFHNLAELFDRRLNKSKLSQTIERLFDRGMLTVKYKRSGDEWHRVYFITGEALGLAKNLYDKALAIQRNKGTL